MQAWKSFRNVQLGPGPPPGVLLKASSPEERIPKTTKITYALRTLKFLSKNPRSN
jgi:hypothetical protein